MTYSTRSSAFWVRLQQGIDEMLSVVGDILPVPLVEDNLCAGALLDQVLEVLAAERRVAAEEGVGDDAHGPHVDGLAVALLEHDFWGGVAEGASHGGEDLVLGVEHLGDAKVGEDEVGVGVGGEVEKVLWLEI